MPREKRITRREFLQASKKCAKALPFVPFLTGSMLRSAFSSETSKLDFLDPKSVYLALFKPNLDNERTDDDLIGEMDESLGYPGYCHTELIFDGNSYGSRPERSSRLSIHDLEGLDTLNGYEATIGKFDPNVYSEFFDPEALDSFNADIDGAMKKVKNHFLLFWDDKRYCLLTRNCADAVFDLLYALGMNKPLVQMEDANELLTKQAFKEKLYDLFPEFPKDDVDFAIGYGIRERSRNYPYNALSDNIVMPGAYRKVISEPKIVQF